MSSTVEFKKVLSKYRNDLKSLKREAVRMQQDILKKLSCQKIDVPCKFNNKQEAKNYYKKYFAIRDLSTYNKDELTDILRISGILVTNINITFQTIDTIASLTDSTTTAVGGNISSCLWLLNHLYLKYQFDLRSLTEYLGMVIRNNWHALKMQAFGVDYPEEIKFLSTYFNNDGTFRLFTSSEDLKDNEDFNKYMAYFKEYLEKIKIVNLDIAFVMSPEEEKASLDLTNLMTSIENLLKDDCLKNAEQKLKKSQEELLDQLKKALEIKEGPKETLPVSDAQEEIKQEEIDPQEALSYLKNFYENGFLINIPEDLEEFQKYLKACDIPSLEKNYIWNTLMSIKDDEIISSLKGNNKRRYLKVLQVLYKMNFNTDIYFKLREERNSLLEAEELLKEASDPTDIEIIEESQTETINKLENIVGQYLEENQERGHLIYLNSENGQTYLEEDLTNNHELYPEFKELLTGLLTGTQTLERIENAKDIEMPIYMVSNQKAHLYLVEVMLGIYVVVGLTSSKEKRKNIQNRVFKNKEILEQYQESLFDYRRKNEILHHNLTLEQKLIKEKK